MKLRRVSEYVLFFWIYAVIGWIYEVVLETFIYRWGFSNRGVLFGPWLPVYGFGATVFLLLWYHLIKGRPLKRKLPNFSDRHLNRCSLGCKLVTDRID